MSSTSFNQAFVDRTLNVCNDPSKKGLAAALRRGDNPNAESATWEYLAGFNIDISQKYKRLPYTFTAAAIAKSKATVNGQLSVGAKMRLAAQNDLDQMKPRLRRLLASNDTEELVALLRSLLPLLNQRADQPLDFIALLNDIQRFHFETSREQIKARWARDFYRQTKSEEAA